MIRMGAWGQLVKSELGFWISLQWQDHGTELKLNFLIIGYRHHAPVLDYHVYLFSAQKAGRFDAEIEPVDIKTKKGIKQFAVDEHPRPDTTPEQIAKLPSIFMKNGTVNAGNASVSIL